jgi:hypothetical protein
VRYLVDDRLIRIAPPPNLGVVDWLRSCPSTDWFTPVQSESTGWRVSETAQPRLDEPARASM